MLIDSNILIYAINSDSPKHKKAQEFLTQNASDLQITHQNILEAIRVLTHNKFSNPMETKDALTAVLAISESLKLISPTQTGYYLTIEFIKLHNLSGNRIFDAYLAATAISNDIKEFATDNTKDFNKFKEIKVINPFK